MKCLYCNGYIAEWDIKKLSELKLKEAVLR